MNSKNDMCKILFGLSLTLAMTACNSATKKQEIELEKQVQAQPVLFSPEQIAERASKEFSKAPGLTEHQKEKLMLIYLHTYSEAIDIRNEIGRSKALLFSKVADVNYKSNEIEMLKNKIVKLDQKRLNLMFKALSDVQDIVGYGADKAQIYKHLYNFEMPTQIIR